MSLITLPGLRRIDHVGFEQTTTPLFIEANLNGRQQTPPNPSTAIGVGSIGLNGARTAINIAISCTGLAGSSTAVRLRAPAPRGIAAGSIRDLPVSGASAGTFSVGPFLVTASEVDQLRAGQWYVSVSSSSAPNGEIRGQFDGILFEDGFE